MTKRKQPELMELAADAQLLLDAMNGEPDLPCVLIAASFLDHAAAAMLARFFIVSNTANELLNFKGALGGFAVRVNLCYVLGLIAKEQKQCLLAVAEIRNLFAHKYTTSFGDSEVVALCEKLTFPSFTLPIEKVPRERFVYCAVITFNLMVISGMSIEKRKSRNPVKEVFMRVHPEPK